MPSTNVELVSSIYTDWERGDFASAGWADPGIEMLSISFQYPGNATGFAEIERFWDELQGALGDFRVRAEEVRELDGERVLAFTEWSGHGRASGIPVHHKGAHLFQLSGERVVRLVFYEDRSRALADLELES